MRGCRRRAADHDDGRLTAVELIARGRDADVFALDADTVLRRYRAGGDTAREAAVLRHVAEHRYPAPRVYQAEGPDLVLERVGGPTLLAALASGEVAIRAGATESIPWPGRPPRCCLRSPTPRTATCVPACPPRSDCVVTTPISPPVRGPDSRQRPR